MAVTIEAIRQRLLSAEDDFLSAMIEGPDTVVKFSEKWAILQHDIDASFQLISGDEETSSMVHTIATRVTLLAESFQCLYTGCDAIRTNMMDEVETILSNLTFEDISPSPTNPSPIVKPTFSNPGSDMRLQTDILHDDTTNNGSFDCRADILAADTQRCLKDSRWLSSPVSLRNSPAPSLSASSSDESNYDDVLPEPRAGHKRPASPFDPSDGRCKKSLDERSCKRTRTEVVFHDDSTTIPFSADQCINSNTGDIVNTGSVDCVFSLPSALDVDWTENRISPSSKPSVESTDVSDLPSPRRKRRLSDAHSHWALKHPRGSLSGRRLYAVSDPLPLSTMNAIPPNTAFDNWFQSYFDVAEVSTAGPDPSTPLDADIYNGWVSLNAEKPGQTSFGSTTGPVHQVGSPTGLDRIFPAKLPTASAIAGGGVDVPSDPFSGSFDELVKSGAGAQPQSSMSAESDDRSLVDIQVSSRSSETVLLSKQPRTGSIRSPATISPYRPFSGSKTSTQLDMLELFTISSKAEPSSLSPDMYHAAESEQGCIPYCDTPPPSFMESMGFMSTPHWDRFWDPSEYLDVSFASPPPPYCLSSENSSFPESLLWPEALEGTSIDLRGSWSNCKQLQG